MVMVEWRFCVPGSKRSKPTTSFTGMESPNRRQPDLRSPGIRQSTGFRPF